MKTTRYFDEQVRFWRPTIGMAWRAAALASLARRTAQPDGRIRLWLRIDATADSIPRCLRPRYLRDVTLDDSETIHNAFFDRDFREDAA